MNIAATCKFCPRPILVIVGDSDVEIEAAEKWRPSLCCDRCGNFRVELRKHRDTVARISRNIAMSPPEMVAEVINRSRDALAKITKRIATLACDYYRIQNTWEADFVDNIIENPTKSDIVIATYINGVSRISKSA